MPVECRVTDVPQNIHDELPDQPSLTPGGSATIVLTGDQTDGTFALVDAVVRRKDEPPLHLHTREDEVIYVLDGEIEVSLAGNRTEHVAGDAIYMPKGCEHAYRLRSETARLFHFWVPAGMEGFYRELDHTASQDRYVERLITLAARYGMEITGPGLRETSTDAQDVADTEGT
jgi:quercetin dioxygenase-like cupin family protein